MDSKLNNLRLQHSNQKSDHSSDTEGENYEANHQQQNIMNKLAYYNARDSIH
jgi:hypothetical protein